MQINSELSALIFWAVCRRCRHTVIKLTDTTDLSSLRRSVFSLTWLAESPPLQITWSGWRALTKVGVNTCIFHFHNFLFIYFLLFFACPFHCSLWGFSTYCCLPMVSSQSAHYDLWPLTSARQFSSDNCCTLDFFFSLWDSLNRRDGCDALKFPVGQAAAPTTTFTIFQVTSLFTLWLSGSDFSFSTFTRYAKTSKLHFSLSHGENKKMSEKH